MPYSFDVLNIFDLEIQEDILAQVDQLVRRSGSGDPNGVVGSYLKGVRYYDETNDLSYICSASDGSGTPGGTTWSLMSGGGGGSSNALTAGATAQPVPGYVHKSGIIQPLPTPYALSPSVQEVAYPGTAGDGPIGIACGSVALTELIYTANSNNNSIGVYSLGGSYGSYTVPTGAAGVSNICVGPDFLAWFTETNQNKVGKMTDAGVFTEYTLTTGASQPQGIATGPDDRLWGCSYNVDKIFAITTSGVVSEYSLPTATNPTQICAHTDGYLYAVAESNHLIKIATDGTIVAEYSLAFTANYIASGHDGNLYVTEGANVHKLSTAGAVLDTYTHGSATSFEYLAAGPDGSMWIAHSNPSASFWILRPNGYLIPCSGDAGDGNDAFGICAGSDGRMWVACNGTDQVLAMQLLVSDTSPLSRRLTSSDSSINIAPDYQLGGFDITASSVNPSAKTAGNVIETVPGHVLRNDGVTRPAPIPYSSRASGSIAQYGLAASDAPSSICVGPYAPHALYVACPGTDKIKIISMVGGLVASFTVPTGSAGVSNLCCGPDLHVWFTETNQNKIGKVDSSGTFTEYTLPTGASQPLGIATAPDGTLWGCSNATDIIFTSDTSGSISEIPLATAVNPTQICAHSDGKMYALADNMLLKIDIDSYDIIELSLAFTGSYLCSGPDGFIYITEGTDVHKVDTEGTVIETYTLSASADLRGICAAGDGALWVSNNDTTVVGSVFVLYPSGYSEDAALDIASGNDAIGICAGPDGRVYAAASGTNRVISPYIQLEGVSAFSNFASYLTSGDSSIAINTNSDGGADLSVANSVDFARRQVYINPILNSASRTLVGGGTLSNTAPGGTITAATDVLSNGYILTHFNTGTGSGDYALERETVGVTTLNSLPIYEAIFALSHNSGMRLWLALTKTSDDPRQSDTPNNTLGLRFATGASDTNFQAYSKNTGSTTVVDTGVTPAASTIYHVKIDFSNGSDALFYLNGTLVATISTNLPVASDSLTPYASISATAFFAARTLHLQRHQAETL